MKILTIVLFAIALAAQEQKPTGAAIDPPWTSAQVVTPDAAAHQIEAGESAEVISGRVCGHV